MYFRDLGPVTVEEDGVPVPLSGGRLWAVLAVLLVNARSAVSSERIVDAVWGDEPPARPAAALDSLLWRLRRTLDPGRSPRAGSGVLKTTSTGYLLAVADDDIDSRQFLLEAAQASAALRRSDAVAALVACDAALDRWRGHPFDGVQDTGWLTPERERLGQAWIEVAETRVQTLLQLGRPEQAASEAAGLLTDHPFRERLWGQRMLGLYRAGRQADALAAYERARQVLADELGVDPGSELNELQAAVLRQDPSLLPTDPTAPAPAGPVRSRRRPRATRLFGRDTDFPALSDLLARGRLVTLAGPMGVGKTALATTVAAAADDPVFVDLTAVSDEGGLLAETAAALGLGTVATDPRTLVIERLRTSDVLLVLDNCEHILPEVVDLVADVMATAPQVRVLATSREPLDLPGELIHRLAPLPTGSATELFLDRVGNDLDASESHRAELIDTICAAVGGLPLGIELAARRARTFRLEEIADRVTSDPGGLARDPRSPRADRTLAATIEDSHRLLSRPEQLAHRRLSVLAPPFTLPAAAAVLDEPESPSMDLLAALAHRSLLGVEQSARQATRFRQLVPLRADGHERLVAAGELASVEQWRATWVLTLLREGPRRGRPGQREWYEQIEADFPTVVLTIDTELDRPGDTGALLAVAVQGFCYDRNRTAQGLAWLARAAVRDSDGEFTRAAVRTAYGAMLTLTRQAEAGRPYLDAGTLALMAEADAGPAEAAGILVDAAAACWVGDEFAVAGELAEHARQLAEQAGVRHEADLAEAVLVASSLFTGDPVVAQRRALELIDSNRLEENGQAQMFAYATAGIAAIAVDPAAGLRWTAESLRTAQRIGAHNLGGVLEQRAGHLLHAGRPDDAVRCLAASAAHADMLGEPWPSHPGTTAMIDALRSTLPAGPYQAAEAAGRRIVDAHGIDVADWL